MSIFDNFNNRFGQLGMPANLGLLTTGVGLLDGQNPLQAIQAGIGTYGSFQEMEEDKRRKAALTKLLSDGGFTDQEKGIISASNNPASVAAQIRNDKLAFQRQQSQPLSNIAKLKSDLDNNRITQQEYEERLKVLNYIKPVDTSITPLSPIGKIQFDYQNEIISKETRDQALAKALKSKDGESFSVELPDGTSVTYGGSSKGTKLTEQQGKDLGFATRLPNELLDELDKYDSYLADFVDITLEKDPTGYLRKNFQDPNYQMGKALSREFVTPLIRKDTGAAIQAWETSLYDAMYFPVPGDTKEVIERKRKARRIAVEGLRSGLPPLLRIQVDPEFAQQFKEHQEAVLSKDSPFLAATPEWAKATGEAPDPSAVDQGDAVLESAPPVDSKVSKSMTASDIRGLSYDALLDVNVDNLDLDALKELTRRIEEGK